MKLLFVDHKGTFLASAAAVFAREAGCEADAAGLAGYGDTTRCMEKALVQLGINRTAIAHLFKAKGHQEYDYVVAFTPAHHRLLQREGVPYSKLRLVRIEAGDWAVDTLRKARTVQKEVASLLQQLGATPPKSQCQTQKVAGLLALQASNLRELVPQFTFFPAKKPISCGESFNSFWRPCPVRPRHGFVESRVVKTPAQVEKLVAETLAADPEAEIIAMKPIEAEVSAIWTRGLFAIGKGNAGATEGKDAMTVPALGDLVPPATLMRAGVKQSPFIEIVYDAEAGNRPWFVQLRDGPAVPTQADFIPGAVTVKRVLLAEGDLLEWEHAIAEAEDGTVVYHPGGTLASHFSVHAVVRGLPVLTSRRPKLGEKLEPNTTVKRPDIKALRTGFVLAATVKELRYEQAVDLMLSACHHASVWLGERDFLLGVGMGAAWRLTIAAALGEMRHLDRAGKLQRQQVYEGVWDRTLDTEARKQFTESLASFAGDIRWSGAYGGKKWYEACNNALVMYNTLCKANAADAISAFNALVNAAHNTGWLFNKFASKQRFDTAAACPVRVLLEVAPFLYGLHLAGKPKLALSWRNLAVPKLKLPKPGQKLLVIAAQAKPIGTGLHIQYKLKGMTTNYVTKDVTPDSQVDIADLKEESWSGSKTKYMKLQRNRKGWGLAGQVWLPLRVAQ